jgi:hypothetical protein
LSASSDKLTSASHLSPTAFNLVIPVALLDASGVLLGLSRCDYRQR